MIYELRTYTLKPGSQPTVARNAGEVARDIRGDAYGKLEGYWLTEIGTLNQVVHLWSYASFDERARLRTALGENERWREEYLPLIRPHLIRQDIRLMRAVLPLKPPETTGNIYELRAYRFQPTRIGEWAQRVADTIAVREEYSICSGAFVTDAGQPNEAVHIWPYPSLDARAEARARAAQDSRWQSFLEAVLPLLEEMQSTIMVPASHSPLK